MEGQPNKREGGDGWRGSRIDEALNLDCRGTLSLQLQEDRVELRRQMREMKLKKHKEKQKKEGMEERMRPNCNWNKTQNIQSEEQVKASLHCCSVCNIFSLLASPNV